MAQRGDDGFGQNWRKCRFPNGSGEIYVIAFQHGGSFAGYLILAKSGTLENPKSLRK